jgi:DNA-binding protein
MSTLRKYKRVNKTEEKLAENEIRLNARGSPHKYIAYAAHLFNNPEKPHDRVVLKASGLAIPYAVTTAEVLRRRIKGLAQINNISSKEVIDEYLPIEEGLSVVQNSRRLVVLEIILTREPNCEKPEGFYQPPLPESEIVAFEEIERRGPREGGNFDGPRRGRGRGDRRGGRRGGRGGFRPRREFDDEENPREGNS